MYQEISIHNHSFLLHPCGVIFWKEKRMLLIADVHLGKVSHFRKFGSAVPQQAVDSNFNALTRVVEDFEPEIVCFLGDLFHSSFNKEWLLFEKWIHTRNEKFILVAGNHDIISPFHYEAVGMEIASELVIGDFLLTHHPTERDGFFNFSGHIHPGIRLSGLGRQTLKLSCFFKSENQLILPAFGTFTGNYYLKPEPGDAVFAITKNEVIQVY
ncbi:ligase-associated DNA damage response endonuclease PdeM [Flavimarina sp. Hel_I_48]|uniref:ligase-associated DNA damage response endonuclease PdeM n=1 Tax=Flavimarina sp. Hel_I_48 TaxID=1392488 RepID=UPI0004DF75E0|nr:ligase-associated DNA damage response endonuclease PdeM [Flavimarina sp. Hel_I_48]